MEDKRQEIAQKMRELMGQSRSAAPAPETAPQERVTIAPPDYAWLPPCADGEFLLSVPFEGEEYICCVREPTWKEAARIEMYAFRKHDDGREYFAGEYERRELMRVAIRWVADPASKDVRQVKVLSELSYDFGDALWGRMSQEFFIQFEEAKALSGSARRFFSGEVGGPVHPFILDIDGMTKGMFSYTQAEWSAITMSDFERYQIIWREYYHHLAAPPRSEVPPDAQPAAARRSNAQAMSAIFGKGRPR